MWCGKPLAQEIDIKEREATLEETQKIENWRNLVHVTKSRLGSLELDGILTHTEFDAINKVISKPPYDFRQRFLKNELGEWEQEGWIIRERHPTGKYGKNGLSMFCTLDCGFAYAVYVVNKIREKRNEKASDSVASS